MKKIVLTLGVIVSLAFLNFSCSQEKSPANNVDKLEVEVAYDELRSSLLDFNKEFIGEENLLITKTRPFWRRLFKTLEADVTGALAAVGTANPWVIGGAAAIFSVSSVFTPLKDKISFSNNYMEFFETKINDLSSEERLFWQVYVGLAELYPEEEWDMIFVDQARMNGFLHNMIIAYAYASGMELDFPSDIIVHDICCATDFVIEYIFGENPNLSSNEEFKIQMCWILNNMPFYLDSEEDIYYLIRQDYPWMFEDGQFDICNIYLDALLYLNSQEEMFEYTNGFCGIVENSEIPSADRQNIKSAVYVGANSSCLWGIEGEGGLFD